MIIDVFAEPMVRDALAQSPLTFVDVGAAVGVEEPWLSMLRAAPDLTRVVAFEPNPDNLAGIKRLPNGAYHPLAISQTNGRAKFYLYGTWSSLENRSGALPEIEVETRRLDSLREGGTIGTLDIVKTDVEFRDYEALESARAYLESEVLAVQCEFGWQRPSGETPFRDYDSLLGKSGFTLFDLSIQRGAIGEIEGGNLLYLRSAERVTDRVQAIKLFVVAVAIGNLAYAHTVAHASADSGMLTKDELGEMHELCFRKVFIPDAMRQGSLRWRLSSLLGMAAHAAAGPLWRANSTPKSNRIGGYTKLFRKPNFLWPRARVEARYAAYYEQHKLEASKARAHNAG